jgi:hypothetical protein
MRIKTMVTALVASAAVLAGLLLASAGQATAQQARAPLACSKTFSVTFIVYAKLTTPTSGGCWNYERVNPSQNSSWAIGHWTCACLTGSGPNRVYDDTSPEHDLSTENFYIDNTFYGQSGLKYEYMARRTGSRCSTSPCWVQDPHGYTITRYYAELYSGDSDIDAYLENWQKNPSIGRPTINVNTLTTQSLVQTYVSQICQLIGSGTYMSIYSDQDVSSTKLGWIDSALDSCN